MAATNGHKESIQQSLQAFDLQWLIQMDIRNQFNKVYKRSIYNGGYKWT
jgi:hypothetical protein